MPPLRAGTQPQTYGRSLGVGGLAPAVTVLPVNKPFDCLIAILSTGPILDSTKSLLHDIVDILNLNNVLLSPYVVKGLAHL
jgi:hypothetical protein